MNNRDTLLKLYNTASSTAFRRLLSSAEIKELLIPLIGDSLPVSDLGLKQSSVSKLSRAGITRIDRLLKSFPDELNQKLRNPADINFIGRQLEIYIRDILDVVLSSIEQPEVSESIPEIEDVPLQETPLSSLTYPKDDHYKVTAPTDSELPNISTDLKSDTATAANDVPEATNDATNQQDIYEHFIKHPQIKEMQTYYLQNDLSLDELGLSVRSYNTLRRSRIDSISKILLLSEEKALSIHNLGKKSIDEIRECIGVLLSNTEIPQPTDEPQHEESVTKSSPDTSSDKPCELSEEQLKKYSGVDLLTDPVYREMVISWFAKHDISITNSYLSNRAKNAFMKSGIFNVSQILRVYPDRITHIRSLGENSLSEIIRYIEAVLKYNREPIISYIINGDEEQEIYTEESITQTILKMYQDSSHIFYGFSFKEYREVFPGSVSDEDIKQAVSALLREGKLEYVDFRCYKVYPKFCDYLSERTGNDIHMQILKERCDGKTIQCISDSRKTSKQRIQQILSKTIKKIRSDRNVSVFDDDYYEYLYTHYSLSDEAWLKYIKCSPETLKYLHVFYAKGKNISVENALEDKNVTVNLKYRLQKYLDKDKVRIDGKLIPGKRNAIENYLLKTHCTDEVTYEEFAALYNSTLQEAGVDPDDKLYMTEEVIKTRQNRISGMKNVLWKHGERLRYYDINAYDFSDLIDTIGLADYHNVELSTYKWFADYPELMQKYDIRDHYELHNVLKKIINPDDYDNDISFRRMPTIRFGEFDRDRAIFEIITELSPIGMEDLVDAIHSKYGYSRDTITATYLSEFSALYHDGVYSTNKKQMSIANMKKFLDSLTGDYYAINDLKELYIGLFVGTDKEEINSYTLRKMGFKLYSGYVIRNFDNSDDYFRHIVLEDNITDIKSLRQKYSAAYNTFTAVVRLLNKNLDILYFEPDKTINYRKLEKMGVSKDKLKDYCEKAIQFAEENCESNGYFTIKYLRALGFEHELELLGLDDYFYNSLLSLDDRLASGRIYGSIVLCINSDDNKITRNDYCAALIRGKIKIRVDDIIKTSFNKYGVEIDRYNFDIVSVSEKCGMYYDKIMETLYKDKSYYYEELETFEMEDL